MPHTVPTETRRVERAAAILAAGREQRDQLSVSEAARIAWTPGGPTVAALEALIARQRAYRATA